MAKKSNSLTQDPTRTRTLRDRASGDVTRKYKKIQKLISESIVENNIFQLNASALKQSDFVFLRDPEKLERFDIWLRQISEELILPGGVTVTSSDLNWLLEYFKEAYDRGVSKSNSDLARTLGRNQIPEIFSAFDLPYHIEKTGFLFSRDFTQLRGITEAMGQQINLHLSDGLLQGYNPKKIAKKLNERVDKIGITRSKLLARTEIINTHNLGYVNEGLRLSEVLGEEVVYEWISSGDGKVRPEHTTRNRKIYSYDKVIQLIGEPNCRCSIGAIPIAEIEDKSKVIR